MNFSSLVPCDWVVWPRLGGGGDVVYCSGSLLCCDGACIPMWKDLVGWVVISSFLRGAGIMGWCGDTTEYQGKLLLDKTKNSLMLHIQSFFATRGVLICSPTPNFITASRFKNTFQHM